MCPLHNTPDFDSPETLGLTGTHDSLAYRVAEIERHLHSGASWFEAAASASGETHVADRIGSGNGVFVIDAGDDTWGAWVQVLGSSDTPARTGMTYFDPHLMTVATNERTATYFVQFARGTSGDAGYAAGTYTELVLDFSDTKSGVAISIQTGRAPAGSKLWARCMCPGQNTGTLGFYMGIHEYEG